MSETQTQSTWRTCALFAAGWALLESTPLWAGRAETSAITAISGGILVLLAGTTPLVLALLGIRGLRGKGAPTPKGKSLLETLLLAGVLGTIFFVCLKGIGSPLTYSLEGEGLTQTLDGLENLKSPGLGAFGTGYLSYPSRQYSLQALPTYLFGRNFATLSLGTLWIFLCGVLALTGACLTHWKEHPDRRLLTALTIAGATLIPSVLTSARWSEQTAFPPGATLLFLAAYLLWRKNPGPLHGLLLISSTTLLFSGYTPSFAAGGLALCILCVHAWKKDRWILIIPIICALRLIEFAPQRDPSASRLKKPEPERLEELKKLYLENEQRFPETLIVILLAGGVLGIKDPKTRGWVILTIGWSAAVLILSQGASGSFFNNARTLVQRHQILYPVLALGAGIVFARYLAKHGGSGTKTLLTASVLILIPPALLIPEKPTIRRWKPSEELRTLLQTSQDIPPAEEISFAQALAPGQVEKLWAESLVLRQSITYLYPQTKTNFEEKPPYNGWLLTRSLQDETSPRYKIFVFKDGRAMEVIESPSRP